MLMKVVSNSQVDFIINICYTYKDKRRTSLKSTIENLHSFLNIILFQYFLFIFDNQLNKVDFLFCFEVDKNIDL